MASELENYFEGQYRDQKDAIAEIERLTSQVLPVFVKSFDRRQRAWPYQLVTRQAAEEQLKFSFSTTTMIMFALSLVTGRIRESRLVPAVGSVPVIAKESRDEIDGLISKAIEGLRAQARILKRDDGKDLPEPWFRPPLTMSATFGWDDPFTLTWLLELLWGDASHVDFRDEIASRSWEVVRRVLSTPAKPVLQLDERNQVPNAFALLRVLQLGETLSRHQGRASLREAEDLSEVHKHLDQRVHQHLSESAIRDSGFDAADLAFSLEAWILCSVEPNPAVTDRAFGVIGKSQETIPYWRPLRPVRATPQGLVLLPQSVEMANSLLRICAMPALRPQAYFSQHLGLFERYWRWLLARAFHSSFLGTNGEAIPFVGWESEHTYTLDRIHLWETSQALVFLQHYSAMLQEHVARTSLRLAGMKPRREAGADWDKWKKSEPFTGGTETSVYHIYDQIDLNFVKPRLSGTAVTAPSSILLYGPPGTGKSKLASMLAAALGFEKLDVTPSDFITAGGEAVEARAKAIFDVLKEQRDLVVLFDEIDQLLLDRDSGFYRAQGDVFKLLTPGMLTKLADLADQRRVLFVVATNYYERIDRAIKRQPRIDAQYLVLPPDLGRRTGFFESIKVGETKALTEGSVVQLAKRTVRFTYKELDGLVQYVERRTPERTGAELQRALEAALDVIHPIISLDAYYARLFTENGEPLGKEEGPWEEFALLAYLELEANDGTVPEEPPWLPRGVGLARRYRSIRDAEIDRYLGRVVPE